MENNGTLIRKITFHKGINLIIDETKTADKKESGNNVGKTTVLRLVDYCLGGDGKNIYQDPEFKSKSNSQIEQFLKNKNILITLILKESLEDLNSTEIVIRRNFLKRKHKIQEIDGENLKKDADFTGKLKELIFHSEHEKPSFRQIISKNIRDEKNRLLHTIKVLHATTKPEEYEALYLFWLGISLDSSDRKQELISLKKIEEGLQKRLRKESNLSQINQSLLVINRSIEEFEERKNKFNLNENFNQELSVLNQTKSDINKHSTELSRLEMRKELILESKDDLEKDLAKIDTQQISRLYKEAKSLVPDIQKSYEETLAFHNQMVKEKIRYITQELPELEIALNGIKRKISELLITEKNITARLVKTKVAEELQQIISELNRAYEKKGNLEELKRLWESSIDKVKSIEAELEEINKGIFSKDTLIQERVAEFNKYFSTISLRLYGEQFVLSTDKNDKGYELNISSLAGNLGTGKKKGQIAAFDLAYIQFADSLGIECLHFILQDQIENIHDNQISNLLTEIVSEINCQFVLPVLKDKLPNDIDVKQYEILTLSQSDKLFKII